MKRLISILLTILFAVAALADGVSFTGKAPAKVGVNQRIRVQYTLSEKPSSIELGKTPGFSLVGGPAQSSSTSTSIVNGNVTTSSSYTYTYTLEATEVGSFSFEPAVAVVKGTKYTSNAISITVQEEPVKNQQQQQQQSFYDPFEDFFGTRQQQAQPAKAEISPDDVLLKMSAAKTNLTKGEGTILTIKLCSAVDLYSIDEFNTPKFNDFYVEEIEIPELEWQTEVINNVRYNTAVIKKYLITPRVSGSLTLESADATCSARVVTGRNFFGYTYGQAQAKAKSGKLKINVGALPSEPAGFSGAVGKFAISLSMPNDTVMVNDAINCKITISGTGNFDNFEAPGINAPKEFEVFSPVISDRTVIAESGLSGNKTWEYTLVPRYGGSFNLGKVNFTYFDLSTRKYNTISTEDIVINVKKGNSAAGNSSVYSAQKNIEVINPEDVRYIKLGDLHLVENYKPFFQTNLYFIILFGLIALFVLALILMRKSIKERKDLVVLRRKRASKISTKRLKLAKKYMHENKKDNFYEEVITALWNYASDKLSIEKSKLTKDNVRDRFAEHGVDADLAGEFVNLIGTCEFEHFVSNSNIEMADIYRESTHIIMKLEEKIK
ncbi:MAG: protein BatD [Bacteroidales bacterium]|nr:protein BatD [Bacteroidales bacterium]